MTGAKAIAAIVFAFLAGMILGSMGATEVQLKRCTRVTEWRACLDVDGHVWTEHPAPRQP